MSNAQRFDNLYNDVKNFSQNTLAGNFSAETVTTLVRFAMETVQTVSLFRGMKGSEKKQLVIAVVTEVVKDALKDTDLPESTQQTIMTALSFAPFVIDMAVDFAKVYVKPSNGGGVCKVFKCCR